MLNNDVPSKIGQASIRGAEEGGPRFRAIRQSNAGPLGEKGREMADDKRDNGSGKRSKTRTREGRMGQKAVCGGMRRSFLSTSHRFRLAPFEGLGGLEHFKTSTSQRVNQQSKANSPWVSTKSGMVQSVEAIVVREGDVCGMVQQQSQHVIPFLRDRIVKGSVTFRVLETKEQLSLRGCRAQFSFFSFFLSLGIDYHGTNGLRESFPDKTGAAFCLLFSKLQSIYSCTIILNVHPRDEDSQL
ncbi:hypothetical protein WN51_01262 [Melipona quadrifasciata]|uniref:Uncharacterized protein n=1 Tax=Melipona quadrifasciata TaxID=166423 RepID=A0A0M8ZX41_9HYME|nr:hypothetical protein WN51_01262 [Melipona quadrifasciata]